MILDKFALDGQVAIITGAGRGIGAATAVAFAEAGADVVIAARTAEQLEKVAEKIRATGRRAVTVATDLSDTSSAAKLVEAAMGEFGRLDSIVNNVGGTIPNAFLDTSDEYLNEAFHFNVTTAHALTRAAVPHLLRSDNPAVVSISSVMGHKAGRGFLAYGTAKAALAHWTRLAATDLAPRIRVNGIFVGSIMTSALEFISSDESMMAQMESGALLGRVGDPEEIAAAALFLASRASSYVTGTMMAVDGGLQRPSLDLGLPDLAAPTGGGSNG